MIGNNASGVGTVTIGSGSLAGPGIYVGNSGAGNMTINANGKVSMTNFFIGNNATSSGSVAVSSGATLAGSGVVGNISGADSVAQGTR